MPKLNDRELSERDLLIRFSTEFKSFKEYVEKEFKEVKDKINGLSNLESKVAVLETKVKENDKFRYWIYGAILTSLISVIGTFINYILK